MYFAIAQSSVNVDGLAPRPERSVSVQTKHTYITKGSAGNARASRAKLLGAKRRRERNSMLHMTALTRTHCSAAGGVLFEDND